MENEDALFMPYPATTYKVYRSFENSLSIDFKYQVTYSQLHLPVAVFAYMKLGDTSCQETALL